MAGLAVIGGALGFAGLVRAGRGNALESARGAAGLVLGGAFVRLGWRLRPRDGYGVRVEQTGRWAPRWVLTLTDGTRRELPRALFSDPALFSDLGRALGRPEGSLPGDA
ncbi:MAG: hypothetical protein ACXU81_05315 [Myxococcaceae bacterium]